MVIDQKLLNTMKKWPKIAFIYVGITMVWLLHLTTRCTSTMAAGEPLRRLLHDCRNTPSPFRLPPCPPKGPPCPWPAMTQTNTTSSTLTVYSYSQALWAPPPKRIPLCQRPHFAPTLIIPPVWQPFAKGVCLGSWWWHSLAHSLTTLLPLPIGPSHQPLTSSSITHSIGYPSMSSRPSLYQPL